MNPILQTILRFLFSHVGLLLLLILYTALGAYIYHVAEEPKEKSQIVYAKNLSVIFANNKEHIRDMLNKVIRKQKVENQYLSALQSRRDWLKSRYPKSQATKNAEAHLVDAVSKRMYSDKAILDLIKYRLDLYHDFVYNVSSTHTTYKGRINDHTELHWTFPSAFVFAVTALTLIGYGHIKPLSEFSKLFTIIFCLLGIPLTMLFLADIGSLLARMIRFLYSRVLCFSCATKRRETELMYEQDDKGNLSRRSDNGQREAPSEQKPDEENDYELLMAETEASDVLQNEKAPVPICLTMGIIVAYVFFGAVVYYFWEGWPLVTAFYCAFTTLTTIGFGDFVPGFTTLSTTEGQLKLLFAAVYIVAGLAIVAMGMDLMVEEVYLKIRRVGMKIGIVEFADKNKDGVDDEEQRVHGHKNTKTEL